MEAQGIGIGRAAEVAWRHTGVGSAALRLSIPGDVPEGTVPSVWRKAGFRCL